MITIVDAVTFSVGGVLGYLLRAVIDHRLARSRTIEAMQIADLNKAALDFHAAFAPAVAQINLAKKHSRFDVSPALDLEKVLGDSLIEQATVIEKFRDFVPESQKTKYQEAWENYRIEVAFGFDTTRMREDIDDPYAMYEYLIHDILAFAKKK